MSHKAGFVNIIGYPNAGKSTLMNELLGEKLSIVTAKEQTTRHRIFGMLNAPEYQIVFSDTPGILEPKYRLQESMMKEVSQVFADADHLLVIVDMANPREFNADLLGRPVTVLLNKLDLVDEKRAYEQHALWCKLLPKSEVMVISALHKHGTRELIQNIVDHLPESPPFYPKDQLTDKSERFIVSEIVRKQVYELTSQEVPYSTEVVVNSFKETKEMIRIQADVVITRESQKAILLGHAGKMIKRIGITARMDIEAFFQKKVYLELFVKVDKDWRTKAAKLKKYGYQ